MPETSIQQGDRYEEHVALYIKQVYEGRPGVSVYCKKKYPQRIQGGRDLEIDISIEEKIFTDRASAYDKLTIIECKDHKHPVKREVIDHLILRKEDVRANDAICFSTNVFQQGAIDKAKDAGIKLGVLKQDNPNPVWFTRKNSRTKSSIRIGNIFKRLGVSIVSSLRDFQDSPIYIGTDVLYLLDELHSIELSSSVPYISPKEIENVALQTLEKYRDNKPINIDLLKSIIKSLGYNILIDSSLERQQILGVCNFREKQVHMSPSIYGARQAFTLAHELGHILLHWKLFEENRIHEAEESELNYEVGSCNTIFKSQYLEVQANKFAAYLLMPQSLIMKLWREFKMEQSIWKPTLYLDSQRVNQDLFRKFVLNVNAVTTVSSEALKYRLLELGILNTQNII